MIIEGSLSVDYRGAFVGALAPEVLVGRLAAPFRTGVELSHRDRLTEIG